MRNRRRRKTSRPKKQKPHLNPTPVEAPVEAPAHRRPRWTQVDIWVVNQYAAYDAANPPTIGEIARLVGRTEHSVRAKLRELTGTSSCHSRPGLPELHRRPQRPLAGPFALVRTPEPPGASVGRSARADDSEGVRGRSARQGHPDGPWKALRAGRSESSSTPVRMALCRA